ncbi:hypothetical protein NV379_19685 [Paenibacillus sp. N1-5-1-14]|uniref:hypothetical protein n=1 Tax=Paenibacillus radicibacter TaxID=2972488 RepID=UPI002158BF08|nr:hypothetical protein [Paenibacillus radicibacter]MCR8644879.1 hypothetical protein [Paenibacillus radicibacter]
MDDKTYHFQMTHIKKMILVDGPTQSPNQYIENPEAEISQILEELMDVLDEADVKLVKLTVYLNHSYLDEVRALFENYAESNRVELQLVAFNMEPLIQLHGVGENGYSEWLFLKERKFWMKTAIAGAVGIVIPLLAIFFFLFFALRYD